MLDAAVRGASEERLDLPEAASSSVEDSAGPVALEASRGSLLLHGFRNLGFLTAQLV